MTNVKALKLAEIDFVRAIAVFSVIMIHVSANYVELLGLGFLMNQWSRFAVPLFLLLSGLVLHLPQAQRLSAAIFYRRRFGKILFPYLLWSVFYVLFTAFTNRLPIAWSSLPSALIYGTGYYHLYFVIILLQLYLLYPLLSKWLARTPLLCLSLSFTLTFASEIILYLAMFSKILLPHASSPIYLVAFPSWLFFFVLGMYLGGSYASLKPKLLKHTWQILALWLLCFFLFYLEGKYFGSYRSSIRLMTIPYACSSGLALLALPLIFPFPQLLQRACTWVANQGFLIYLLHPAILTTLLLLGNWLGPDLGIGSFIGLYLATAGLSIISILILQHLPGINYLGGVRQSSNSSEKLP